MSISIGIVPIADAVDMYGSPDPSSAYSLAGHIAVSISSSSALIERQRTTHILLHSMSITFEGQSETITPTTGYSSVRLCSVSREIVPNEPMKMSNEGHEGSDTPCIWNVVFDLAIPGWLPPSSMHGSENLGIRYALFAEAKYTYVTDQSANSWSFSSLYSTFRSRTRTLDAYKRIQLRRFIYPSGVLSNDGSFNHDTVEYMATNIAGQNKRDSGSIPFPRKILSKMQVMASVPEYVNVKEHAFPLVVLVKVNQLEEEQRKRIQITSLSADLVQKEKYRRQPSIEYLTRYPVPPLSQQPPYLPFRDPDPLSSLYEVGFGPHNVISDKTSRSFSLLPPDQSRVRFICSHNYPFAGDNSDLDTSGWYTLETFVPFVRQAPDDSTQQWAGSLLLQPSGNSPLIKVTHKAVIELTCIYDIPETDGGIAVKNIVLSIPLCFGHFSTDLHHPNMAHPLVQLPSDIPHSTSVTTYMPPAYSQLFEHNGDRKIDYSIPLPLYTPSLFNNHEHHPEDDANPSLHSFLGTGNDP